jgi:holdfast attachment protein HfaA
MARQLLILKRAIFGTRLMAVRPAYRRCLGFVAGVCLAGNANAGDFSDSATYNAPAGMTSASGNQASNYSLRDDSGNLTIINGMFASTATSQTSGAQSATASTSGAGSQSGTGAGSTSGTSGAGSMFGGASAIGNQLNVVTVGNYNTVIVNSTQTNNGNQNASVVLSNKAP